MRKRLRPKFRFSPGPPYSEADLAEIAHVVGLSKFPAEHVKPLQELAVRYRLAQWMQAEGLPSRREMRKLIEQLAEAARKGTDTTLADAWADLPYPAVRLLHAEGAPILDVAG